MAYCSLEEAWGENYANLYKKNDSMLPNLPKTNSNLNENFLQDRTFTEKNQITVDKDMTEYYMNKKNEIEHIQSKGHELVQGLDQGQELDKGQEKSNEQCNSFIDHFMKCSSCRDKVNRILNVKRDHNEISNQSIIEGFMNYNGNMDAIMLLLIGIIVIFILEYFTKR